MRSNNALERTWGHRGPRRAVSGTLITVVAFAVAFHAGVAISEWSDLGGGLAWFIWSIVPFAAAMIVAARSGRSIFGVVPALVALGFAGWSIYAIRTSTSSTAAIYYLWFPLWNLIGVLVLGIGGYFMWRQLAKRGRRAT